MRCQGISSGPSAATRAAPPNWGAPRGPLGGRGAADANPRSATVAGAAAKTPKRPSAPFSTREFRKALLRQQESLLSQLESLPLVVLESLPHPAGTPAPPPLALAAAGAAPSDAPEAHAEPRGTQEGAVNRGPTASASGRDVAAPAASVAPQWHAVDGGSGPASTLPPTDPQNGPSGPRRKGPDYYANVGDAIRTLREDIPRLFQEDLNYEIYRDDIVFRDPRNMFQGKENYKLIFWSLRFHGRLFFSELKVDVKRVWQPEDSKIQMRWQVRGIPRVPWKAEGTFDGVSMYKLDREGKVAEHYIDNVILRDPPVAFRLPLFSVQLQPIPVGQPGVPCPGNFVTQAPDGTAVTALNAEAAEGAAAAPCLPCLPRAASARRT